MQAQQRKSIEVVVRCLDLTSLEEDDTDERIGALCERAVRPDPDDPDIPPVAAVCVLPRFAVLARGRLVGSGVRVAVATGSFPEGTASVEVRCAEIRSALADGADEIDTVLDHQALLAGGDADVRATIEASREACGGATMKVILETGALPSQDHVRRAAGLVLEAGADFVKCSTGKAAPGVTPEAARAMMEAVRDFRERTGRAAGVKLSGGIRTAEQALGYAAMLREVLSEEPRPASFRIGASAVLDDLVLAIREPA